MFFSYTLSVCLLAFGIYGLFCVLHDIWEWLRQFYKGEVPEITVLVIVKNRELDIEYIIRYIAEKITGCADSEKYDIVVADRGSDDLTLPILEHLADEFEFLTNVRIADSMQSLSGLPLCWGKAVYILDLTHRLTAAEFYVAADKLLR